MNEFIVIAINRSALEPKVLSSFDELIDAELFVENLAYEKADHVVLITQIKARYKLTRVIHP